MSAPKTRGELMPTEFPHRDEDGEPYLVTYYTAGEAAPRLHVTHATLRDKCKRGEWPHLRMGGRIYLSDEQLARVVEMLTVDPDEIGQSWRRDEGDRRLGVVVDDDELEGGVK
jgi:excisionase family DNA binding protein